MHDGNVELLEEKITSTQTLTCIWLEIADLLALEWYQYSDINCTVYFESRTSFDQSWAMTHGWARYMGMNWRQKTNCRRWNHEDKIKNCSSHSRPWSWQCNEFDRIYFDISQWYCHPSKFLSHKDIKIRNLWKHLFDKIIFKFLNEIQNFSFHNICDTCHAMCDREHNWSWQLGSRYRFENIAGIQIMSESLNFSIIWVECWKFQISNNQVEFREFQMFHL